MNGSPSTPSRPLPPPAATGSIPPRPAAPPVPAQAGGEAVLALCGDIDLLTAGAVLQAARRCLRGRPARLLLDLRQVGFSDAAGARALRQARDEAAAAGAELGLVAPGPPVTRVLTLIGVGDLLPAGERPRSRSAPAQPGRRAPAGRGGRRIMLRACRAGTLPAGPVPVLFAAWRRP